MYKLFVDLDGVLVDFEKGVLHVTGRPVEEQTSKDMWRALARHGSFYADLDWMIDGKDLWAFAKSYDPTILTGLPWGGWAESQKRTWCARELGEDIPVITCMSREKAAKAREASSDEETPILVDDRIGIKESWEAMGGVFIHHKDAQSSVEALTALLAPGS